MLSMLTNLPSHVHASLMCGSASKMSYEAGFVHSVFFSHFPRFSSFPVLLQGQHNRRVYPEIELEPQFQEHLRFALVGLCIQVRVSFSSPSLRLSLF